MDHGSPESLTISTIITIVDIMAETTTIQIAKETRDALKEIGSMGDDYNKVIKKLIEEHKEHIFRLKIDKLAKEADNFTTEHRDEFVSTDEL